MFRPTNSLNPAHLVNRKVETQQEYLEELAENVRDLAELEEDPEEAARLAGQDLWDRGEVLYQPESLEELVETVRGDDSLLNALSLSGAETPLEKASKELVLQYQEMDLRTWVASLLNGSLE
jgi:hypothetical protein